MKHSTHDMHVNSLSAYGAMTQLKLPTAISAGRVQGAACLEKTRQTEQSWPERAYAALTSYINTRKAFKAGESFGGEQAVAFVLRQPGIESPHDCRAFGALFAKAARCGLIRRSTTLFPRACGHGTKAPGWETV